MCGPCLINGRNFNLSVETSVSIVMSRPQRYVTTSNDAFHLKTSCNFFFFAETSFVALLTNPRRDIRVTSRPQLHSIGVETSELTTYQPFKVTRRDRNLELKERTINDSEYLL